MTRWHLITRHTDISLATPWRCCVLTYVLVKRSWREMFIHEVSSCQQLLKVVHPWPATDIHTHIHDYSRLDPVMFAHHQLWNFCKCFNITTLTAQLSVYIYVAVCLLMKSVSWQHDVMLSESQTDIAGDGRADCRPQRVPSSDPLHDNNHIVSLTSCGSTSHQPHSTLLAGSTFISTIVEQGSTYHSTQFRSFRRRYFYRSDDPTNSVNALKEGG